MNEPKAVGEVVNLGGNQEVTIEELAKRIIELSGSRSEIRHIPYEEAYSAGFEDMRRRVPDTTKLRNTIGYTPDSDLDSILRDVIDYFQNSADAA